MPNETPVSTCPHCEDVSKTVNNAFTLWDGALNAYYAHPTGDGRIVIAGKYLCDALLVSQTRARKLESELAQARDEANTWRKEKDKAVDETQSYGNRMARAESELASLRAQPAPQTALQRERLHDAMQKYAFWYLNNVASVTDARRTQIMDQYIHECYVEVAAHPAPPKVDRKKLSEMLELYRGCTGNPEKECFRNNILDYVCGPAPAPAPKSEPATVTTEEFARWRGCAVDRAVVELEAHGVEFDEHPTALRWWVHEIRKVWPDFKPEVDK